MTFAMSSVGSVRSARRDPANSDHWGQVTSAIVIDERFGANCLAGLAEFSHVEVLFVFDQARERDDYREPRSPGSGGPARGGRVRRPRAPPPEPHRRHHLRDHLRGRPPAAGPRARRRDGTPVLDLKPVMLEFLPSGVRQPARVGQLMHDYFRP